LAPTARASTAPAGLPSSIPGPFVPWASFSSDKHYERVAQSTSGGEGGASSLLPDAVQVIDPAQEQGAAGRRRRRPEQPVQLVPAHQLHLLPRLDHERRPRLVQAVDLAALGPRR